MIMFGQISSGAVDDLEKVTKSAYSQVFFSLFLFFLSYCKVINFGMNKKIGLVSYSNKKKSDFVLEKPYSEETAKIIDIEVRELVLEALMKTKKLLSEKKEEIEKVAKRLLEREVLKREDLEELLGKRPFPEKISFQDITGAPPPSENNNTGGGDQILPPEEINPQPNI